MPALVNRYRANKRGKILRRGNSQCAEHKNSKKTEFDLEMRGFHKKLRKYYLSIQQIERTIILSDLEMRLKKRFLTTLYKGYDKSTLQI